MAIRINSITLYPNPVLPSKQYRILISISELASSYVLLKDSLGNSIFDSDNKTVMVVNSSESDTFYQSDYTGLQIDEFIASVGV